MQVTIEAVDFVKTNEQGTSSRVKASNGDFFYVQEDATGLIGKTVEAEVTEKFSKQGKKYKTGKIVKVIESASSNGKITWDDYRAMAEAAHGVALRLEPDLPSENGEPHIDRSSARAAILNTVMIAYSNGKIVVPEEDDEPVPF